MIKDALHIDDIVNLTSKRFGYTDPTQKWIVLEIGTDYIVLTEDDRHKIELFPARGQSRLRITSKYLTDFNINKVTERLGS